MYQDEINKKLKEITTMVLRSFRDCLYAPTLELKDDYLHISYNGAFVFIRGLDSICNADKEDLAELESYLRTRAKDFEG